MKDYKIAVIGDIHSNHTALERCAAHALEQGADEFLFLGDYVSDCPYPQKTMDIVYEMEKKYQCTFIRGNREDYMIKHRKNKDERWTYSSASGSLLYTYENLTKKDFSFFESIDIKGYYEREGYKPFRYCHGSLTRSNGLLTSDNPDTEKVLNDLDVDLLISGHTHKQEKIQYGGKKIIHPGAVGVPHYHDGKAQYMILHGNAYGWEEEFFRLEYDVESVIEEFETSGLNEKAFYWAKIIKYTLRTGIDNTTPCLQLAMKLCRESENNVIWPDIPEKYWKRAAEEFGIKD